MKRISQSGKLDMDAIYSILEEEKPNQREQIKICASTLEEYFPDDFTPKQKVELIERLVKSGMKNRLKIMEGTGDYMNKIRIYDLIWIRNLILWHGRAFTAKMWGKDLSHKTGS